MGLLVLVADGLLLAEHERAAGKQSQQPWLLRGPIGPLSDHALLGGYSLTRPDTPPRLLPQENRMLLSRRWFPTRPWSGIHRAPGFQLNVSIAVDIWGDLEGSAEGQGSAFRCFLQLGLNALAVE